MAVPRNSLQAVLDRQAQAAPPSANSSPSSTSSEPDKTAAAAPGKAYRPSREGQRLIAGHFNPKVAKQLKLLAAEEETTIQALLEEALDLLFLKKGQGTMRNI